MPATRDRRHLRPGATVEFLDSKGERSRTPVEFRDVLLAIARSAHREAP